MKKAEQRQRDILDHLINVGPYPYDEIMKKYDVSIRTMKADIAALNSQGYRVVGVAQSKSYELIGGLESEAVFYDKPDRKKIRKLIILLIIISAKAGVSADHDGSIYIRDHIGNTDDPLDVLQEDFEEKDVIRTIENTLEEMLCDGDLHISGGKYIPAVAAPLQLPLCKEDGARLLSLLISSAKGHPKEDALKEIAKKLSISLTGTRLSDDDFTTNVVSTKLISQDEKTEEIIKKLEAQSYTNNSVKIEFENRNSESVTVNMKVGIVVFSPDKNRTYLIGETKSGKIIIDASTVISVSQLDEKNDIYRSDEYIELAKSMFEISSDNPVHVKVEFDDIPSIREKLSVICRNRQNAFVIKSGDKLLFEDEVSGIPDFAHFLRRFGYGAKVLEPAELSDKMVQSAKGVLALYEEE